MVAMRVAVDMTLMCTCTEEQEPISAEKKRYVAVLEFCTSNHSHAFLLLHHFFFRARLKEELFFFSLATSLLICVALQPK